jgi:hypothetical protein
MAVDSPVLTLMGTVLKEFGMESFTAEDLMEAGRAALEALYHEPPLGPVPNWLAAHELVYDCVAGYEDRIEELDRWKVQQLHRWLQECLGGRYPLEGSVYELQAEAVEEATPGRRFRLRRTEHLTGCVTIETRRN